MLKLLTGAACALALAHPVVAQAAVVTLTATGTGSFGLDQTGVLGPAGLLDGRPLTITLSYDTSLAPAGADGVFSSDTDWFSLELAGDGAPFVFAGQAVLDRLASIELIEDGASDRLNLIYQVAGLDGEVDHAQSLSFSLTGDLFASTAALPLFDGPLAGAGSAEFSVDDFFCPEGGCVSLRRADGGLTFTAASAVLGQAPLAVPEPSAWMLTIVGFGFAGATLRRRRTTA